MKIKLKSLEEEIAAKKISEQGKDNNIFTKILSPQQTKMFLHDLLNNNNNLVLLQLHNTPPKEVVLPQTNTRVFEHGITIKFLGDYFSTMRYLQAAEKLPWRIFWDKLEYEVTEYPTAEVTIHLHTINATESG
ncbi:MAG: hypothetical protein KKE11_05775 [Gammaproteobacteria bacterium]|nr:hypothetical protein [Gammaproteobacteria bacterium]